MISDLTSAVIDGREDNPIYIYKKKLWCWLLNLLAGDLRRPSCIVLKKLAPNYWYLPQWDWGSMDPSIDPSF